MIRRANGTVITLAYPFGGTLDTASEKGLLGVVADPNVAQNHAFYFYVSNGPSSDKHRVYRALLSANDTLTVDANPIVGRFTRRGAGTRRVTRSPTSRRKPRRVTSIVESVSQTQKQRGPIETSIAVPEADENRMPRRNHEHILAVVALGEVAAPVAGQEPLVSTAPHPAIAGVYPACDRIGRERALDEGARQDLTTVERAAVQEQEPQTRLITRRRV